MSTGVKPPAASVLSHSSAILLDSSNVAPTPPPLFQTAAHGHHIILISLLCETCRHPSPCHEKAANSEGFGADQSVPNSLGTPICLGLSQKEHPPTTSSVRDTRCETPPAHLPPLGGECAGGRSLFPAHCTHMAARTHKRHWSHSRGQSSKSSKNLAGRRTAVSQVSPAEESAAPLRGRC